VSATLLLNGVMVIYYRSPTITIWLSLSVWSQYSQCKRRLVASPGIRTTSINFQIFVTVATGVGLRQISLTQYTVKFANPKKPPAWCKNQEHISHRSPVTANFLLNFSNFRYHGYRGCSETKFTYTVKFADPENPLLGAIIGGVSTIEAEL